MGGIVNILLIAVLSANAQYTEDPAMYKKWGLSKIDWQNQHMPRQITVAIIDTGIDEEHEDLEDNLWVNPGETGLDRYGQDKATNGKDDDRNGFVDDVHGWDFASNDNSLEDNHGHGTHIAGIVGAVQNNGYGISGVASNVKLMILKYYDPQKPANNLTKTIESIRYAIDNGADVINYSAGGLEHSEEEEAIIAEAARRGIVFVAAAGNERSNSDRNKYYPANYELDNILSVTAINPQKRVLSSSNYGVKTVDIAAPGENIYSTLPPGSFGPMTGTSQATAFASGAVAIAISQYPDLMYTEIIEAIKISGTPLTTNYKGQKLEHTANDNCLNIERMLKALEFIKSIKESKIYGNANSEKVSNQA